jgi:putative peptidoglycan lipid II flippase
VAVASVAMLLVLVSLLWLWQDWTPWTWWQRGWRLGVLVGSGGAVYGLVLWLQGIRPRDLRGH